MKMLFMKLMLLFIVSAPVFGVEIFGVEKVDLYDYFPEKLPVEYRGSENNSYDDSFKVNSVDVEESEDKSQTKSMRREVVN